MDSNEMISKLKEWVEKKYNAYACGWTVERSRGNFDDCFDDGHTSGKSWAAYEVGKILGMDLEEPEEPWEDY